MISEHRLLLLTGISAFGGAKEESDRKRYIGIIQERIGSLKEMLEELFTYTKLQNGTYELKLERQNMSQILKETVFSYYDNWMEQGIRPQFEITEEPGVDTGQPAGAETYQCRISIEK